MHLSLSRATVAIALSLLSCLPMSRLVAEGQDARFKVDLLLVVAHPDDDVLAGTYFAKLLDEGKRIAVVFMTSGESGGNAAGVERATSLGLIRQTEARKDLSSIGITTVWFLTGRDTAGQDPRRSLAVWGHGRVLADTVRIVRLTRPEVMLTWLPLQVAGENHGDHQAASVVATEAFDAAGDASQFPEQLAAPVKQFESEYDGLEVWQPKKLYFMSDATDTAFMTGRGPSYPVTERTSKGVPYWQVAYQQLTAHVTQYRAQLEQLAALTPAQREQAILNTPGALTNPLRFIRGKSVIGGAVDGDIFTGLSTGPVHAATAVPPAATPDPLLTLGGPWAYYRQFWRAHGLSDLASIATQAIGPVNGQEAVRIPLQIANAGTAPLTVTLKATLPTGWQGVTPTTVTVPAGTSVEVASKVTAEKGTPNGTVTFTYEASAPGQNAVSLSVPVVFERGEGGLPQ